MKSLLKDLWLAILLILGASAVLLLSDLPQRNNGRNTPGDVSSGAHSGRGADSLTGGRLTADDADTTRIIIDFAALEKQGIKPSAEMLENADVFLNVPGKNGQPAKLAMITLVENPLLEDAERGVISGLTRSGLKENEDFTVKKYNAQGEIGQLTQIIGAALQEKPDLIVSVTTPAMIAVVNKVTDVPVVFTVASNPFKIGLFKNSRPGNVCGVHDNPSVDLLLDMARDYDPGLTAVGTVYDPAQSNSVLSVEMLRKAGADRKIKVLEATASSVPDLGMAAQSLIQRGAKAIILSADNLTITGFPSIQHVAGASNIPVFTTEPQLVEQGATGAIGDSYFDWGEQSGKMAAKIIAGVPPSRLPITETKVKTRIDPKDISGGSSPHKTFKIRLVQYNETPYAVRSQDGIIDGMKKGGLAEGKDYELRVLNAQGDMSTLSSIMTSVKSDQPDLLFVISTPVLQAALRQLGPEIKIVFTGVADAVAAGAGKSESDHLPNVTGITTRSPFDGMARLVREMIPGARNVGTLFSPAETNSVLYKDWLKEELEKLGIGLTIVPVNSTADLSQSAAELCRHDIQAVCQIADHTTREGFALVARKASENNLPVFTFDSDEMINGSTICLARDYYQAGFEAAEKAILVLKGENPAHIPINVTQSEKMIYNPELAEQYHLVISESFKEKATIFTREN